MLTSWIVTRFDLWQPRAYDDAAIRSVAKPASAGAHKTSANILLYHAMTISCCNFKDRYPLFISRACQCTARLSQKIRILRGRTSLPQREIHAAFLGLRLVFLIPRR